MSLRLVQIANGGERRAARVEDGRLRLLDIPSVYELSFTAIRGGKTIADVCEEVGTSDSLDYESIYQGRSDWRLLPSFDHPTDSRHCVVSGTGLTHKKSAENRSAMHDSTNTSTAAPVTDSMRMYQWGLEGGAPASGEIGAQPEWFYKGDGSILRGHGESLTVPAYAEDGGEEPEIAGVYVIGDSGEPYRVGWTAGNEFSDHKMERRNYLYLAHSKLRVCAIGPELTVGEPFPEDLAGTVKITRAQEAVWEKAIRSGQANMCHTLDNLEHHHFKYALHCQPGDAHLHFFGADAFSFGDGFELREDDVMEVSFPGFGRALRNPIAMKGGEAQLARVKAL